MISVSSPAFSFMSLDKAIETVAKDFRAWEIVAEGRHRLPDIEERFMEISGSYDLEYSVHAPLSDINIGSLNPSMREASLKEILLAIESCGRLGIDLITVHPGFITPLGQLDHEAVMKETRRSLRRSTRQLRRTAWSLHWRTCPGCRSRRAPDRANCSPCWKGRRCSVCFDIGHAHTNGNIDDFVKHVPLFANVHIHDNNGKSDQHLAIGEGKIDFDHVLSLMAGYRHRYVIEARKIESAPLSMARLKKLLDR